MSEGHRGIGRTIAAALGGADVVIDLTLYVAPRTISERQAGRVKRRAQCGHDVWLSPRGVEAVDCEGKTLLCSPCQLGLAGEFDMATARFSAGGDAA